jgi:autotransporter-associated beta strand protein
MQMNKFFTTTWLCAIVLTAGFLTAHAQTTATWTGSASGGEWNTDANWDTGLAPADATTNAFIGPGTNVSYNLPMVATSFGGLTNRGILNVNTNGFNSASIVLNKPGGGAALFVNTGGVMNVTGDLGFCSNSVVSLSVGSSLTISGNLNVGSNPTGGSGSPTLGAFGILTNNGGTITAAATTMNSGNASVNGNPLFVINGGTNNLGAVDIGRPANTSQNALGNDGLIIKGGFVNMTSLRLGNNNWSTMLISPGAVVTNTGSGTFRNVTANRPSRLLQTGGLFVTLGTNLLTVPPTAGNGVTFSVTGGTNYSGGFQFGDANANLGTVNFTNAATIYVGSSGILSNGVVTVNISLNTGGRFGASTDWTNTAPITLNGGSFDAQDAAGTAHNIYSSGLLRGSTGGLNKTGAGTLTLTAINTYSGNTTVTAGTLALATDLSGSSGSIANSPVISMAAGATFDVSQTTGFVLGSGKTIAGLGTVTGNFAAGPSSFVSPAGAGAQGKINFGNGLAATNANFTMELTDDPTGIIKTNDQVNIIGDFTVSDTNNLAIIQASGSLSSGTYKLVTFTGNFIGDITNLSCASGTLTNPPGSGEIDLIVSTVRPVANLVWTGDGGANLWDNSSSNWLNGVAQDHFYTGDNVLFNTVGTSNTTVNLVGSVLPASVMINTTSNYVLTGSGSVDGTAGLIKTNSGTLTISTTNTYTGSTVVGAGVLEVLNVANGGIGSAIGAANATATNLMFFDSTFRYSGESASFNRGATLNGEVTVDVTNASTILTDNGGFTGLGVLTKSGAGNLTLAVASDYSGGTIISNGVLALGSSTANTSGLGTNAVTFKGGTLQLFGYNGSTGDRYNAINNPFIVSAGQTGTLQMFSRGPTDNTGITSPLTGGGTLNLVVNVTRASIDGNWSAFTGLINVTAKNGTGDHFRTKSTYGYVNAAIYLNDGVSMYCNGSANSTIDIGELGGTSLAFLGLSTVSQNNAVANPTWRVGAKNTSSTFAGVIRDDTHTSIIKVGTGTWTLTGANTYSGSTTISNGVLALINDPVSFSDGSIGSSTNISIKSGAFLDVSGRSDGTMPLNYGQVISGNGTIRGILDTTAGGTVSPDDGIAGSTGTLTVTNSINLGGTAWMKLNRASSPNSDRLVSSTASIINYGGTLVVTNIGASLQAGDTFTLFSAATLNSSFTFVLPNYYTWNTSQLTVNGSVSVTAVLPLPSIITVDFSGLAGGSITLNANNGAPNGPVSILTSTNLVLPLSSWTTVTTTTFDGSGNLSLPITVDPTLPQSFYLLQVY